MAASVYAVHNENGIHVSPAEAKARAEALPPGVFDEARLGRELATRGLAKGGSEGVDWSTLSRRVGTVGTDANAEFELCCFISHEPTSTEAAIWRDCATRRVVLAFRGTSDVVDIVGVSDAGAAPATAAATAAATARAFAAAR